MIDVAVRTGTCIDRLKGVCGAHMHHVATDCDDVVIRYVHIHIDRSKLIVDDAYCMSVALHVDRRMNK